MTPTEFAKWVAEAVAAQQHMQVFLGAPDDVNPCLGFAAGSRKVATDPDGRAHMYAAVYVGYGTRDPYEDSLDERIAGSVLLAFQVTVAGGDTQRCSLAAEKVFAALDRRQPPGCGVIRLSSPQSMRTDRDPSPSRQFLPITGTVRLP